MRGVFRLLLAAPALAAGAAPQGARAENAPRAAFDIPAQPLDAALLRFSRQTGLQIIYPFDAVRGLRSSPVRGRLTPERALARMIAGLPLRVAGIDRHMATLAVIPAPRAPSPAAPDAPSSPPETAARPVDGAVPLVRITGPLVVTGRRLSEAPQAIGQGRAGAATAITRAALLSAPSGISGLKMLEQLPGFNVQTDGPLGLYEFGNSVQTRAFNLDQIGFVLDGIPMGRSDAFGGSPIFRYVDNENLAMVEASPGSGDVSLPSYSSLGPIVRYRSIAPDAEPGLFTAQTVGSNALRRNFLRLSTGAVGPVRAYVSRTTLNSDLWRGAGSIDRTHWEGQAVADLGTVGQVRFKVVANDFFDYDSPTLTRADYVSATPDAGGKTGRERGYVGTVATLPETVPGIPYSSPDYAYYYGNAFNRRKDRLYGLTLHFDLAPTARFEIAGYHETKNGAGSSADDYANSQLYYSRQQAAGLAVVAPRGLQYGITALQGQRSGLTLDLALDLGRHAVDLGLWAENDSYHRTQKRLNRANGAPDGAILADEVVYYRRDYRSRRETVQAHIRDRIALDDGKTTLDIGIKMLFLGYRQSGYGDLDSYALADGSPGYGPQTNRATYGEPFLPALGLIRQIGPRTQIFASYAENAALPKAMDSVFSVPSPAPLPAPRAERAHNAEIGIRTSQPRYFAALTAYRTRFDNRIQALEGALPGTNGVVETYYRNVGSVRATGLEFTGTLKPALLHDLAYFNANLAYNIARYRDDLPDGTAIAGNILPDSARWLLLGGMTVEPASWLVANITGKYTSRRFANAINTSSVPGFLIVNAYVDLGDGLSAGPLKAARLRINVDNLFDRDVLSYISQAITDEGEFRPLAPRSVQVTLSARF